MLKSKVEGVCVDNTGAIITIKDTTGVYSISNTGGFGAPNPLATSVQKVVITLSKYNSPKILQAIWGRNPIDDTTVNATPTVEEILNGEEIQLTSLTFRATTPQQGMKAFEDGVFDINLYHVVEPIPVTGNVGNIYVNGTDLDDVFFDYDSVLINSKLYQIDKTLPTNGGTLLYFTEPLTETITQMEPAYRANTKVANMAHSSCVLSFMTGKYSQSKRDSVSRNKLTDVLIDHTAARLAFQNDRYSEANDLMTSASLRAKHTGGCSVC